VAWVTAYAYIGIKAHISRLPRFRGKMHPMPLNYQEGCNHNWLIETLIQWPFKSLDDIIITAHWKGCARNNIKIDLYVPRSNTHTHTHTHIPSHNIIYIYIHL